MPVLEELPMLDRRATSREMLMLVQQVHESQVELSHKLTQHMTDETGELAREIAKLMKEAFPDGDPDGHRRRHELELAELEEKIEFRKKMRLALAQWGLFGFLGWVVLTLWNAFIAGPHK